MGIGAGWYQHEFDGYGYPFPDGPERLRQLGEAIQILQAMWTREQVTFEGEHYRLDGAICRPRPMQQPSIPVWVAGGGEKVTLRLAARYGDATNFGGTIEAFTHKSSVLAAHCADLGTDFDRIVRSANFNVVCEDTEEEVAGRLDWIEDRYTALVGADKAAEVRSLYAATAGTPEQLVEQFSAWHAAGMSYAIMFFAECGVDRSGIARFATEVAPALR
jgi:alkanesulfonate monooxygenase SsuD/methylene tetrahydromethanopterin reductase-like flavin-dependent oxidoreductase (luciferase family)